MPQLETITESEENPVVATETTFTLSDNQRCDAPGVKGGVLPDCQARAFVRVVTPAGELFFCGHHFALYEAALAAKGYEIEDGRSRLREEEHGRTDQRRDGVRDGQASQ